MVSLPEEVLGLNGVDVLRVTRCKDNTLILYGKMNSQIPEHCPCCGSKGVVQNGTRLRRFKTVPIGGQRVLADIVVRRFRCPHCHWDRQEEIPFAEGQRQHTRALAQYALGLLRFGTVKEVATQLGLSWDTVKEIHKSHLQERYASPSLSRTFIIGIDEFAFKKGHKYMTIVVDLLSGRILWANEGKDGASLDGFWERLKKEDAHIKYVTSDLSPAYIGAVAEHLPDAIHVYDHFHIVKLMNEAVDKVRRGVWRDEKDLNHRDVIKGTRWILLRNGDSINADPSKKAKLDAALALNEPLTKVYYLKEELRQVWNYRTVEQAEKALDQWIEKAQNSGLLAVIKVANTIAARRSGILSWFKLPISNATVEGVNNKIKVMKRDSYGFHDMEYAKLRLYALHDAKITLKVG